MQSLKSRSHHVPCALGCNLPHCLRPRGGGVSSARERWFWRCSFGLLHHSEMFWNLKFYCAIFMSYLKHSFCTLENDVGVRVPRTSLSCLGLNSCSGVLRSPPHLTVSWGILRNCVDFRDFSLCLSMFFNPVCDFIFLSFWKITFK